MRKGNKAVKNGKRDRKFPVNGSIANSSSSPEAKERTPSRSPVAPATFRLELWPGDPNAPEILIASLSVLIPLNASGNEIAYALSEAILPECIKKWGAKPYDPFGNDDSFDPSEYRGKESDIPF